MNIIDINAITRDYPMLKTPGPQDSHKGTFGTLGITGGAEGMTGAIILAGCAALKTGCGKVILGFNQPQLPVPFIENAPELMLRTARSLADDPAVTAQVTGPGLGQSTESRALAEAAFIQTGKPQVLDADALNILAVTPGIALDDQCVITPHPQEAARLLHTTVADIQADRPAAALALAAQYHCWAVLKGHRSLIASPEGVLWCNHSGNRGLATAGSGDVLSGIIGSLLAQRLPVQEAVCGGVWLHGAAADECVAAGTGPVGLTAHEIIDYVRLIRNRLITKTQGNKS
ncbi:ADP-dependent (S)-NAD(P)H-hydrate dehydratase [Morganella morganii]|uniref:NAD(P)H-hydrate dehydratase n=1 Tax=Morganella morganii TaxID=582 RepID=UPI0006C14D05|nr:NAD(P)H-hydrate dehydratase [Morganella morganii]EGT3622642.1 NAD(P)H-hydrate dehydratase [Morganella morganii]EGT3631626.1 NAD(P)H-hydrate dehydratase [Morganella morganii]EGT3634669.1 NAD(P)H-hydrate dehydratase [Morganella morganii]EKW7746750.1 NAD(P)H-hydrate dehydratase [Morganella morganii]KOO20711.1 ADP-dependent (S)-NAD(P)H-hydrate dehydratase [Morganella morganii]